MKQKNAIAVFVKTPGLSPVKTRLAEGIGENRALEFYDLALECVMKLGEAVDAASYWAVAEEEAVVSTSQNLQTSTEDGLCPPVWSYVKSNKRGEGVVPMEPLSHFRSSNFEALWTDPGSLGQRQHHIYSTLLKEYDHVMLLGTDAPQLTPTYIERGFAKLEEHDFVIGPAHDGGYNFFAGKKDIPLDVWTGVEYSQPTTREDLCSSLSQFYMMDPSLGDVDVVSDLEIMLDEMPDAPTEAQKKMMSWAKETLLRHTA